MNERKYKLVPVEPTAEMHAAMMDLRDYFAAKAMAAIERTWAAWIAAAPEPVCRWRDSTGSGEWRTDCGRQAGWCPQPEWRFCPYCGKKVEVVDNE